MITTFPFEHVHLVGIKGVAMTSLAQILVDAGYTVTGSDVSENFVTAQLLQALDLTIQDDFSIDLPEGTRAVVYTAAHNAEQNPQVVTAIKQGIPIYSQAEAISLFANQKNLIAVCGVGGKSTVSAMVAWILECNGRRPSFSVGVGNIPNFNKTGRWSTEGDDFVIEADEYVTNPNAVHRGSSGIPRFSYLQPSCIIATNIVYDHPDVYQDFSHTKATYTDFFSKLPNTGSLVLTQQVLELNLPLPNCSIISVSNKQNADFKYEYLPKKSKAGISIGKLFTDNQVYAVQLPLPGEYNMQNAVCAIAAASTVGIAPSDAIAAISQFRSTQRRFEKKLTVSNIDFYDDYAHHPNELEAVITALQEWYPNKTIVVAFQPHTYSRTRSLLEEFAKSLSLAHQVILLDIFASARELADSSISSKILAETIKKLRPEISVTVLTGVSELAQFFQTSLPQNSVVLTAGAGNIYQVYDTYTG